jgi:hypothetical protein
MERSADGVDHRPGSRAEHGVHRGETEPEHRVRTVTVMAFHTSMSTDRPPIKPTPVKATPPKLTPPRQTPTKPMRT